MTMRSDNSPEDKPEDKREDKPDDRLEQALQRVLAAPQLPNGFRSRLQASVERVGEPELQTSRLAIAAEYERQQAELRNGYVRLQRGTLATLVGAAFVTGITLTLAMPWIRSRFGDMGVLVVPLVGALIGVALGARSWLQHSVAGRVLMRD